MEEREILCYYVMIKFKKMKIKKTQLHKRTVQIKKINVPKKILKKPLIENKLDSGKKYLNLLMEGKKAAKEELLCKFNEKGQCENNLGLNKIPILLVFATELNGKRELVKRDDLFKLLEGLMVTNAKVIVIDTEQPSDIADLGEAGKLAKRHVIWYNPISDGSGQIREEKEIDRLLLAADMALVFSGHMELIQLLMNYGVVVLGEESSPLLEDYNPNHESGNAFTYKHKDAWGIFASIVRALETFRFPFDWRNLVRKIYK